MSFLRRRFPAKPVPVPTSATQPQPQASLTFSPRCASCTRPAATIEISGEPGAEWLKYSGPGGSSGSGDRISAGEVEAIRAAFTPPCEATRIKAAGFYDDAGFCAACSKFYCPTHWNVSSTGGGKCPAGHFKSLDPHWSPGWDDD
jgi:hypothetical protein